ncbi:unnamed protein product [Trichobilharzia regenti]|nr:unnamed protein product [Trichobilharzia regenti]
MLRCELPCSMPVKPGLRAEDVQRLCVFDHRCLRRIACVRLHHRRSPFIECRHLETPAPVAWTCAPRGFRTVLCSLALERDGKGGGVYNHAFNHCDIVVLSDFSIVHKGDFLSLLPDDTEGNLIVDQEANVDDVNDDDSDIESVILSSVHININKGNNNENNNINNNNCSNTDIDTDTTSLHDNTVHEINEESEDEDETVEEEEDNTTISDVEIPVNRRYHDYRRYSNHDNEKV